jgi:hypothetical protein
MKELSDIHQAFLEAFGCMENVRCNNKVVLAVLKSLFPGIFTNIQGGIFHVWECFLLVFRRNKACRSEGVLGAKDLALR